VGFILTSLLALLILSEIKKEIKQLADSSLESVRK